MRRRFRPAREIAFSFDSFLDVVANVVGIIIRMILVVWVGARAYTHLQAKSRPVASEPPSLVEEAEPPAAEIPLAKEIKVTEKQLAQARADVQKGLENLFLLQEEQRRRQADLAKLERQDKELTGVANLLDQVTSKSSAIKQKLELSLAALEENGRQLDQEIHKLKEMPRRKKVLRYQTPVSAPVHSEELMFECKNGRVTFIDLAAMVADIRRGVEEKARELRHQWQVVDTVGPVGAFRLRYTVERHKAPLEALGPTDSPDPSSNFHYGVTRWVLEPMALLRGETGAKALAKGSAFRQIVDALDGQQSVVTFWVYPDSFELYRQLRDYLHGLDMVVAGRPLPEGVPIASSVRGSRSRGQ